MEICKIQTSPLFEEKGVAASPLKYVAIAFLTSCLAVSLFSICFPLSVLLLAACTWSLFSASVILANQIAEGSRFHPSIQYLQVLAIEINCAIIATALLPFTFFDRYHQPEQGLKGRPILLLNGYFSFGSSWHYQRANLIEAGFGPIYTMNIGTGKSIETYAQHVQYQVKKIQKESGRKDLILIGHSKGGLVSSYFATNLASAIQSEVTDVISIGSPFSGTPIARFAIGQDAREMRPQSPFHRKLREKMEKVTTTRFFHIASIHDQIVSWKSSLIGKDPNRTLLLKDVGHLGLVFSSRVSSQICSWLKASA